MLGRMEGEPCYGNKRNEARYVIKGSSKVTKKHEKVFVGVLTPEGDVVDYTNEDNRNPEEPPA